MANENKRRIRRKAPHPRTGGESAPPAFLPAVLRAAGIGFAAGMLLLLILCAVCLSTKDPSKNAPLFALGARLCAALLTGILAGRFLGERGLLAGLAAGCLLTVCTAALSLCLPDSGDGALAAVLLPMALTLVLSAFGGYTATHKKPKKRKIRR